MRVVALAILSLAVSSRALAQSPPPLTPNGAMAEAMLHNAELAALRQEYDVARAAPAQERFLMPPMFETQIWGWPLTTLNPARTNMYMFLGEQQIPGRGKRDARVRVGERDAAIAQRRIAARANEILADVKRTYFDLASARETLGVYDRQLALVHDVAQAATARYAAGRTGQSDTVMAIGELARLQSDQITWREQARMAETKLNALLGRPAIAEAIEPLTTSAPSVAPPGGDFARLAITRHPMLAVADAEIAREEAELARLRGDRRPDFVVGGGYMLQPGGAGAWTARGGLTWPNAPWSRGKLTAEIDVQARRVEAARVRRAALIVQVRQIVQEGIVHVEAAQRRLDLLDATVLPHAEHEFGLARVTYVSSGGDFGAVISGERRLLAAAVDRAVAVLDVQRALAELDSATGAPPDMDAAQAMSATEGVR